MTMRPRAARTWKLTIRRRGAPSGTLVRPGSKRWNSERCEILDVDRVIRLEVTLDVPDVDPDQDDGDDPLQPDRLERQERGSDCDRVGDREVAHVVREDHGVDRHDVARRTTLRDQQYRDTRDEHREGRQHERCAEDRPDPDTVRRLRPAAGQDRDDRDHRLRQRGAHGREDRSHRPLGELELASEPFDPVREQLGAHQDDHERDGEDDDVQLGSALQDSCGSDAQGDDRQDQHRDDRHALLAPPNEPDQRSDDPRRGRRDHGEEAEPDEAGRPQIRPGRRRGAPGCRDGPPASGAICFASIRTTPTASSATETYVPNVSRRAIERSRSAGWP